MAEPGQAEILLIWVNAERNAERGLLAALESHHEFSHVRIAERDSNQAEIAVVYPRKPDILEEVIDSLLEIDGYDIDVQGVNRGRAPTVVFRATLSTGKSKIKPVRKRRRHVDPTLSTAGAGHANPERVLTTSQMAATSGPKPGWRKPTPKAAAVRQVESDFPADAPDQTPGPARPSRVRRNSTVAPLVKKIARIILFEEPEQESHSAQKQIQPDEPSSGPSEHSD